MLASFKQQGFQVEQNGLLGYEKPLESAWGFACPQIIENDSESMEAPSKVNQTTEVEGCVGLGLLAASCCFLLASDVLILVDERRGDTRSTASAWSSQKITGHCGKSRHVGMTPQRDNCLWYGTNMEYVSAE